MHVLFFQGVDLTNIIKDLALGSGDKHLVLTTVEKLKELCSNNKNDTLIMNELEILKVVLLFYAYI